MISVHFIEGENWNRTFWLWANKHVHHKASQASSYVRQHNNLVSLLNTGMNQRNNHMRKILNTHMQIQIQTIKKKRKKKDLNDLWHTEKLIKGTVHVQNFSH